MRNNTTTTTDIDRETEVVQVDVKIDADLWADIVATTRLDYERGRDPEIAFWDAVHNRIETVPNLVVEGCGERGLEDINGVPAPDETCSAEGGADPEGTEVADAE